MAFKRFVSIFLVILISGIAYVSKAYSGPMDQARAAIETIVDILKDKDLNRDIKRQRISSVVHKRFDFSTMSQRVLATYWKKAAPEDRERFEELFPELLEATYIGRIDAYTNERVEYVNEKVEGKQAAIDTLVITKNADIPVQYKMILKDGEWLVYDVVIEEVSLIRNYRSTYQEIIMKKGFDGLLLNMEEKLKEIRNPKQDNQVK